MQVHSGAFTGIRSDDDVAELLLRVEAAVREHRVFECLGIFLRRSADRTGRNLQILFGECIDDIARCQSPLCQPVGREPDAHAEIIGAREDVADAGNPQKCISDENIGVVVDERDTVRSIR